MAPADQRQLAAIVFTDIVGYTKTMDQDEQVAMNYLKRKREIIYPLVNEIGGKVLKEIGDGMLIKFGSVIQAVRCAVDIQKQVETEKSFALRIGIHIGDIIIENDDVFGSGVNIASRIQPLASPGGICMTSDAWHQIKNQKEFSATSLGTKALKGVQERVEVFELDFGDIATQKRIRMPFLKDIIQRRVPQIIGLYAIGAFVMIKIIEMLVDRLVLSPHITGFCLATLFSLIPSVLIVGYFHGRSASKWTKAETFGVPVNVMASAVFLFSNFYSTDLGSATQTITVEDEDGKKIERVIPKSEFRKNVALFFYDNNTGDTTKDWLQQGISLGVHIDLLQDLFVNASRTEDFYDKLKEAGFTSATHLPLTLQKKIADEVHLEYFVAGSIEKQEGTFLVSTSLYETKSSKLISKNTIKGTDIYTIIDQTSIQLRRDLGIPQGHIDKTNDLPVSSLLTNSISSYEKFIHGYSKLVIENDFMNGTKLMEESVKEDSTFTVAQLWLQTLYVMTNQGEKRGAVFQAIMQHLYKLPERLHFAVKAGYYEYKKEPEKELALVKMWVKLLPEDLQAHYMLAMLYQIRNLREDAIAEYKIIFQLDSTQYGMLTEIGQTYKAIGKNDEALTYYERYLTRFPEDYKSFLPIASLYSAKGEYDKAKSYYQKVLLIKPDDISSLTRLAGIEARLGNFDAAKAQYESTLTFCKTPEQKMDVYDGLKELALTCGQIDSAIFFKNKYMELGSKLSGPFMATLGRFESVKLLCRAGRSNEALRVIGEMERTLKTPFDIFVPKGYLDYYIEMEDTANAGKYVNSVENIIKAFGLEFLRSSDVIQRGKLEELRGNYKNAIDYYQKAVSLEPNARINLHADIGRCYRTIKDYSKAEEHLQTTLKILPFYPEAHYEMALVHFEKGEKQKANDHLHTAVNVWKNADPEYKPAKAAKQKLSEWEKLM